MTENAPDAMPPGEGPPGDGPPGDVPLVFVDDLDHPELRVDDRHHIERVLRVRVGDALTVADGRGRWRTARLGDPLSVEGTAHMVHTPLPRLTIAFALVKGGRPELVTQKLTELGVDHIVPFVAERSVVHWEPDRSRRHVDRLRRVAREASMQSRRCTLPEIAEVAAFADVMDLPGAAAAERHGVPPNLDLPALLIGPEGGWTAAERDAFDHCVGLGDLVLRAETAAIAGAALLTALRSQRVLPASAASSENRG